MQGIAKIGTDEVNWRRSLPRLSNSPLIGRKKFPQRSGVVADLLMFRSSSPRFVLLDIKRALLDNHKDGTYLAVVMYFPFLRICKCNTEFRKETKKLVHAHKLFKHNMLNLIFFCPL